MKPSIILYTHTDYSDVWPIFFGQTELYLQDYKKYVFVNKLDETIPADYTQVYYDEASPYTERMYNCLSQLGDQVILFLHEDMILYDTPKYSILEEYADLVSKDSADFIKLIKAGSGLFTTAFTHPNLVYAPAELLFTVQPTVTSVNKLKILFQKTPNLSIWDFETKVSQVCVAENLTRCYMSSDNLEKKRGSAHWDSIIFPYIATAIVKGKWNHSEYPDELNTLFGRYGIDKTKRGIQ